MLNFGKELNSILQEEYENVENSIGEVALEVANEASLELTDKSPKRTGNYAKSWSIKEISKKDYVVHNEKHYRLTHLLENGHEIISHGKATGRRTQPIKHIEPVEKKYIKLYEERLKESIENE